MAMTWDEAMRHTEATIDALCAQHGVTAELTDPHMIAVGVQLLRIGRRNHHALRAEMPPAAPRR
jgi:hypothetical protein